MRYAYVGEADRLPLDALFGLPAGEHTCPAAASNGVRRLLVLSVSAGSGHLRAAEAICARANARDMADVARHVDVMDYVSSGMRKLYTDWYLALVSRHPLLWSFLYQRTHSANPQGVLERIRRASERWSTLRLTREIESAQPDAIICTHFLPAEILARLKREGRLRCPLWVQITDFDLHRLWVHRGVTGYFVGNDEVAYRLRSLGVPASAIRVSGIPLMPAFSSPPDRSECAAELGLDPRRKTVMLMGGGAGIGELAQIAQKLMESGLDMQVIALAGKNRRALDALKTLAQRFPGRLVAHGHTDKVERLMACSDLVITKPGGLSTSECLAMGLPMILNQPIPGQEERNADYLLEQGVALKACDAATLEYRVRHLLDNPGLLAVMRTRARRLGQAHAAQEVVGTVLGFSR